MPAKQTIIYSPGARMGEAPTETACEIIAALAASEAAFEVVPDICELAARRDPAMRRWTAATDLRIAGLPRRAVKWLFHAAGQTLPENAEVLDTKTTAADEVARRLLAESENAGADCESCCRPDAEQPAEAMTVVVYEGPRAKAMTPQRRAEIMVAAVAAGYRVVRPAQGEGLPASDTSAMAIVGDFETGKTPADLVDIAGAVCIDASGKCACGTVSAVDEARAAMDLPRPGTWVPWFPVVDFDRCTGCLQCANFCLFGVYSADEGLRVANPSACKINCPACARMCPQKAIIFPYYPTGPINGQDVPEQAEDQQSLKEALQGDVYQVLRNRGKSAGPMAATMAGGKPSLADLARIAEKVEIPPQVLLSLGIAGTPGDTAQASEGCACTCGSQTDGEDCACACDCGSLADGEDCNCTCDCDEATDDNCGCDCRRDGDPQTPDKQ